jgi:hypothetical protein
MKFLYYEHEQVSSLHTQNVREKTYVVVLSIFAQTITYMYFLGDFWCAVTTLVHVHCTKKFIFLKNNLCAIVFDFFYSTRSM